MHRRFIPLAFALVVAACGQEPGALGRSEVHDGPPPARFRHDVVATRVIFTGNVDRACAQAGLKRISGATTSACAVIGDGRREIVISNPCRAGGAYAKTLCHELGHLNGWPKDHGR